jgi:tetratricopeptide (TPR) repeat protein
LDAVTLDGDRMLTPRFAAPEQIAHGTVTTATDVYALGVLLYLLLTGHHPAGTEPHTPAQLMKAIVEDETRRASDTIGPDDASPAQRRATTPERLRRQLRGDLDTILGKALKKDPKERYSTVSALADDLLRYCKHEPIRARPDSIPYRAGRFVRRNRAAVALVSLAFLAVTAGLVGTLVQARNARRQRDFAINQLSRAEAINELNTLVLDGVQSSEMLDRAERILTQQQDARLADRVDVLIALGRSADISKDGGARSHRLLDQAYQLSRGAPEPSARAKASCALAGEVSYGADTARSEALVQEGLDALPRQPEFALDRAFCLLIGGAVSRARGAGSEAIARLQLAQRLLTEAPIPLWRLQFLTALDLGNALRLAGRYGEASTQFEQIAARLTAQGRGDTGAASSVYYSWGLSLSQLGRPVEAEKRIHQAIVIDSGGEDSPDALPWQLIAHATALRDLGRLDEALAQAERGYAKSLANGDDARANQALLLRASIYRKRGDADRARDMVVEAESRLRGTPSSNIIWASFLLERALAAQDRGDIDAAFDGINRALAVADASVKAGKQGADLVAVLLTYRSEAERQLGRTDDAIADAARALVQIKQAAQPGTSSLHAGRAYLALGRALQSQGKEVDSRANFQLSAEHFERAIGPGVVEAREARQLAGMTAR